MEYLVDGNIILGNKKYERHILYQFDCPIPIMVVNEGDKDLIRSFISNSENVFIDHIALFDYGSPLIIILQYNDLDEREILVDQQPTTRLHLIPKRITVHCYNKIKMRLCQMISNDTTVGSIPKYKVRVLSKNDIVTLSQ